MLPRVSQGALVELPTYATAGDGDCRVNGVALEVPAEPADVHIDGLGMHRRPRPDLGKDLRAVHDPIAPFHEDAQAHELPARQVHRPSTAIS